MFDFKENLEKRIKSTVSTPKPRSIQFQSIIGSFYASYKEWYKLSTEKELGTSVLTFLNDLDFEVNEIATWEIYYKRKNDLYFEVISRDFLKFEGIKGDVVYVSYGNEYTYLNLHEGFIEETVNPLPF